MKIFKRTFVSILIIFSMLFATSCNFDFGNLFQQIVEDAVWEYSDDGETEINLFFAAVLQEDVKGVFEWDVELNQNEEAQQVINLKYYADKSQTPSKEKIVYTTDEETLTVITIGEDNYYIDETDKTVSTNISGFSVVSSYFSFIQVLGTIDLDDAEMPWTFVEKNDDVTITNSEGEDEQVIEYVFSRTNGNIRYQASIGFKKVITPVLARIHYEVYELEEMTGTITIFLPLHTEEVKESDFDVPGEADGYTVQD